MKNSRVAILGMGLMGGSLARAMADHVGSMVAADPDAATREKVASCGLVERISSRPEEVLPGSDVIILAAPVRAILELIPRLPEWHSGAPLVLDLGSTKGAITEKMAGLPPAFDVLGGHPMCGKAVGGFRHAEPGLFRDAPFAFCALQRTSEQARSFAEEMCRIIGAQPLWVDPARHDEWVGATSHVPYLMSAAQVLTTPSEAAPLMGTGFQSATRLASTPREMMLDVLCTNREAVMGYLEDVGRTIHAMQDLIRNNDFEQLRAVLDRAADKKDHMEGLTS